MFTTIETLQQLSEGRAGILYFSRYRADRVDNGGARRVAQILQLLDGYDLEFVSSLTKPAGGDGNVGGSGRLLDKVGNAVACGRYRKYAAEFANWIFFSRRLARRWVRALESRDNVRLVIVDDPIFFAPLVRALHERKIPIIAHCHNIETLSRAQVKEIHQRQLLLEELELLSLCRAAITISREETFLLRNLGSNPFYLPYFPPVAIEQRLRAVRQGRMSSAKRNFLLLGSAGNPPTRKGMQQIIDMWNDISSSQEGDRLIVAGFGTDVLRTEIDSDGLEFVGAVTDAELDDMLSRVRATIIFQENGAGALTRIAEFLLAGVPVVANSHATRSYYNLPGIIEFADVTELRFFLSNHLPEPKDVFLPSSPDPASLSSIIGSFMDGK